MLEAASRLFRSRRRSLFPIEDRIALGFGLLLYKLLLSISLFPKLPPCAPRARRGRMRRKIGRSALRQSCCLCAEKVYENLLARHLYVPTFCSTFDNVTRLFLATVLPALHVASPRSHRMFAAYFAILVMIIHIDYSCSLCDSCQKLFQLDFDAR